MGRSDLRTARLLGLVVAVAACEPADRAPGWRDRATLEDDASVLAPDLPDGRRPAEDSDAPDTEDSGTSELVHFVDVAATAGLSYRQWEIPDPGLPEGTFCALTDETCEARTLSGGAAAADYDGDGWPDLYVTRMDGPDRLYRNRGDGTFEDVTEAAGIAADGATNGVSWADIDDDGWLDLLVLTIGSDRPLAYVNQGDGTFVEDALARDLASSSPSPRYGTGACFGDYDLDGWLDVYTGHWQSLMSQAVPVTSRLLRNRGGNRAGTFEDVTERAGVRSNDPSIDRDQYTFTPSFTDLDDDGWPDLILVADFGKTRVLWNRRNGTFLDGTEDLGPDVPSDSNGMGLAIGDYNLDGTIDWFVTAISDESGSCPGCSGAFFGNRMYKNLGARRFENATDLTRVRDGGWGWGAAFFDYDHDGDLDLAMTNGYYVGDEARERYRHEPMRFFRNDWPRSAMRETSAEVGLTDTRQGRALLPVDYDGDGDLDLFIANFGDSPVLYRNDGGDTRAWLEVELRGRGARAGGTNRFGRGAKITVTVRPGDPPQVRLVGGCSFLGQSVLPEHFGLGDAEVVHEVRVYWPATGLETRLENVSTRRRIVVEEPPPP